MTTSEHDDHEEEGENSQTSQINTLTSFINHTSTHVNSLYTQTARCNIVGVNIIPQHKHSITTNNKHQTRIKIKPLD